MNKYFVDTTYIISLTCIISLTLCLSCGRESERHKIVFGPGIDNNGDKVSLVVDGIEDDGRLVLLKAESVAVNIGDRLLIFSLKQGQYKARAMIIGNNDGMVKARVIEGTWNTAGDKIEVGDYAEILWEHREDKP